MTAEDRLPRIPWKAIIIAIAALLLLMSTSCKSLYPMKTKTVAVTFTEVSTSNSITFYCDSAQHKTDEVWLYTKGLVQKVKLAKGVVANITEQPYR